MEAPNRRHQTVEQILMTISRYFSPEHSKRIRDAYYSYKQNSLSVGGLLREFESVLGKIKGYRYCWSLALALSGKLSSELHRTLAEDLNKMDFRSQECVLAKHSNTYRNIFKYLIQKLAVYLNERKASLESFSELKINTVIRSIYAIDTGLLIQGKLLQHYISAKSLSVLIHIFFTDKSHYTDIFDECQSEDLITIFLYWTIIKSKTAKVITSTPGFRGLDWMRENEKELDLSFIKIQSEEEVRNRKQDKKSAAINNKDKEEFPTLGQDINTETNQKSLLEALREKRNNKIGFKPNKSKPVEKKKPAPPPPPKPQPKPAVVRVAEPKYRDDSEDKTPVIQEIPVKLAKNPAKVNTATTVPVKKSEPKSTEEHWPKLSATNPNALPVQEGPPLLHKYIKPETVGDQKKKPIESEEDFPTLGGGGPTIQEALKAGRDAAKDALKKPNKKRPATEQGKKAVKHNDQAYSIVAAQNKKGKADEDDFPNLGGSTHVYIKPTVTIPSKIVEEPKKQAAPPSKQVPLAFSAYDDADDFAEPATAPKQDKKKQKKLTTNDFPVIDITEGLNPTQYVSEYEMRRNQPINYLDHLTPEEQMAIKTGPGMPQKKKELKPPTSKKFDDLMNEDDEENKTSTQKKNTKKDQSHNKESNEIASDDKNKKTSEGFAKAIKKLDMMERGEEEFPTFGGGSKLAQSNQTAAVGIRQLVADSSDLLIIKKASNKKKK